MEREEEQGIADGVPASLLGAYWLESSMHESPEHCRCGRQRAADTDGAWLLRAVMTGVAAGTVLMTVVASRWWK
ncbi:hypothetical protein [Streptomyces sp. WM6378]|uniref:hypothetical protein n=1 Tax=Streptomyces sp. WM6378 TaxID=1415557 RepID=UPI0006AF560D|nr:hypothetical protein [Streptomyces sp. WM6378]KOU50645.1 hypothetical protein ADK54_09590 [Streptomyces sp. WM6378]